MSNISRVESQEGRPVQKAANQLTRQAGLAYSGSAPKKPMNDYVPEDEGKTIDVPQAQRKSSPKEAVENSSGKTSPKPEAKPQVIPNLQDFAPKSEEQKDPEKIKEELVKLYTEQFETEGTGEKYEDAQKKVSQTIKPRINWLQKILFGALNMNTERWAKIDTEAREKAMKIVADRKKAEKEKKGEEEERPKTVRIAQPMLQHQAGPPSVGTPPSGSGGGTPPGGAGGGESGGKNPNQHPVKRRQLERYNQFLREKQTSGEAISKDELKKQYIELLKAQDRLQKGNLLDPNTAADFQNSLLDIFDRLEQMNVDPREIEALMGEPEKVIKDQEIMEDVKKKIRADEGLPADADITPDKIEQTLKKAAEEQEAKRRSEQQESETKYKRQSFINNIKRPSGAPIPDDINQMINDTNVSPFEFEAHLKASIKAGIYKEKEDNDRERVRWLPESIQEFARVWMRRAPDQFKEDGEFPLMDENNVFHPENFIHLLIEEMRKIHEDAGDDPVSFWQKLSWDFGGARIGFDTVIDNIGLFFRDARTGKDLVKLFDTAKVMVWQLDWARGTWQIYNQYKGDADQVIKVLAQRYSANTLTKYFTGVMSFPGFTEAAPISNFYADEKGFENHDLGNGIKAATTAYRYLDDAEMLTRTFGKQKMKQNGDYVKDDDGNEILDKNGNRILLKSETDRNGDPIIVEDSWQESAFFNNKTFSSNYIEANIVTQKTIQKMREKYIDKVVMDEIPMKEYATREEERKDESARERRKAQLKNELKNTARWQQATQTDEYKAIVAKQREDLKFEAQRLYFGASAYDVEFKNRKALLEQTIKQKIEQRKGARGAVGPGKKTDDDISAEVNDEFNTQIKQAMFDEYQYQDKDKFFDKDGKLILKGEHVKDMPKVDVNLQRYIDRKINYFREPQKDLEQVELTDKRITYSLAYHVDNKGEMNAHTFDSIDLLSAEIAQLYSSWISLPLSVGYQDTNVRTYDKGGERDAIYRLNQATADKGQNLGRFSAAQKYFYADGFNGMRDIDGNSIGTLIQGGTGRVINFRKGFGGNRGRFRTETMTKHITDNVIRGNTLKEALYAGEDFDITGLVKHHFDPLNPQNSRLEIDWQKFYQHRKIWNAFRYRYSSFGDLNYAQVERGRELIDRTDVKKGFRYFDSTTAERTLGYSILKQDKFLMKVDVDGRYRAEVARKLKDQNPDWDEDKIKIEIDKMPMCEYRDEKTDEIRKALIVRDKKDSHGHITENNRGRFGQHVKDINYPDTKREKIDSQLVQDNKGEMWKWVLIREYAEMLKQHRRKGHKAGLVAEYKDGYTVEAFIEMLELIEGDAEFDPITDEVIMHKKVFNHDHIKYLRKYAGVSKWNTIGREVRMEMAKEVRESFSKFMKTLIGSVTK